MKDLPSVSDYSQLSIKKAVRDTGLFHTLTLYPAAIGAGSAFLGLLFSPAWFWVAIGGGGLGIGNALFNLVVRKDAVASKYIKKLQKQMLDQQRQLKMTILKDLQEELGHEDLADLSAQAQDQFQNMEIKYDNIHDLLQRKLDQGEMTFGRFLGAAEQVYLTVLDNLSQIAASLKSASSIDIRRIMTQLARFSSNGDRSDDEKRQIDALNQRLRIRKDQLSNVNQLLADNEEAMTKMEVSSAEIAKMTTGHKFTEVDLDTALGQLVDMANRAKEY